jgi:hypothetical protein
MCPVQGAPSARSSVLGAVAVVLVALTPAASRAQTRPAGFVKVLAGGATILRSGQTLPIALGDAIHQADTLKTGPDGRLGVTLRDETRLSLGPNTQITLSTFAFSPGDGQLGFVMRVVTGIAAYVSGRLAELAPDSIRIETPSSIIGVRGTHLLISAGPPAPATPAPATRAAARGVSRPDVTR